MMRLLALVSCLLAGSVAAEVAYRPNGDRPIADDRPQLVVPETAKPSERESGSIARSLSVVLARPLFAADRKPTGGVVATDPSMPRLAGIIAVPAGGVAIFQPAGNSTPIVAHCGDMVGGWEVRKVAASSVDLQRAQEQMVLVPGFDNSQTQAAKSVKPVVTRWEEAAPTGILRARWSNPQLQP